MAYLAGMVGADMEIITLLKANIRHKKGSFLSVILLTLIVAMSVTTILSIKEGAGKGILKAHELVDTPNLWIKYYAQKLTNQMIEEVKNDPRVAKVEVKDCLIGNKAIINKEEYTNSFHLMKAPEDTKLLKEDISFSGTAYQCSWQDRGDCCDRNIGWQLYFQGEGNLSGTYDRGIGNRLENLLYQ